MIFGKETHLPLEMSLFDQAEAIALFGLNRGITVHM